MYRAELQQALAEHAKWIAGEGGKSANLSEASLSEADLSGANLRGAKVYKATLTAFRLPEGDVTVWKKLAGGCLARLRIPACAKRVATPVSRKCRAQFAFVERVEDEDGRRVRSAIPGRHDPAFMYREGEWVFPDRFSADWREECLPGIHFFQTREEAAAYV